MDVNPIIRAARFAALAHAGQKRKYGGAPYITHPGRVAARATTLDWGSPADAERAVVAAWLHDVLEDSDSITYGDLADAFGADVANIVAHLTRMDGELKTFAYRKLAESGNPTVIRLKLLDRLDNLAEAAHTAPAEFITHYLSDTEILLSVLAGAVPRGGLPPEWNELWTLRATVMAGNAVPPLRDV